MFYPEGHEDPGHTRDMVVSPDGAFHPFWYDNRGGIMKMWTAKVTVEGNAVRNGSPELADLEDVSERVTFDYFNNDHDPAEDSFSVDAILVNMSDEAMAVPIKVRVTGIYSVAGTPRVTNAVNGMDGVGAVWEFSEAVVGGVLEPGASSDPVRLTFRFDDFVGVRPRDGSLAFHESFFLYLETRVLAMDPATEE
jgi:hypothetical protein